MKKYNLILFFVLLYVGCLQAEDIAVQSPDKNTNVTVGEGVDLEDVHHRYLKSIILKSQS